MGPAGRLGLCLLLSVVPGAALGELWKCSECPMAYCLNATHCGCPPGHIPPPWPHHPRMLESCDDINECLELPFPPCGPHQSCTNTVGGFNCSCDLGYRQVTPPRGTPAPRGHPPTGDPPTGDPPVEPTPITCVDVDECAEAGEGLCGGGSVCFNTPGKFECHCAPGHAGTPPNCSAVAVPPNLCPEEQSDCELTRTLPPLYELLRGGGNASVILQVLLSTLGGAVAGAPRGVPERHRWVTALLGATEGLLQGGAALLPPGTTLSTNSSGLQLALARAPPPGALRLQVPDVQLQVAGTRDTGLAMVALLSQGGLRPLLEGAPPVHLGGWGDLPPPPPPRQPGGHHSYRVLSPVATVVVAPPEAPPEVTLRFQHPPPRPPAGGAGALRLLGPQGAALGHGGVSAGAPPARDPPGPLQHHLRLQPPHQLRRPHGLPRAGGLVGAGRGDAGGAGGVGGGAGGGGRHLPAVPGAEGASHDAAPAPEPEPAAGPGHLPAGHRAHPVPVVAGLLHFSFLAAFCWMGLEGLHLYVLLVRVFVPSWLRVRHLLLAGYGPPALVVAIAVSIFPGGYGTHRYCWLSLERGFRWSFQGPVCLIIAFNAVILVVTVWKLVQKFSEVAPDVGHLRRMRVLVATGAGQLCLLGTTWALGLGLGLGGAMGGGSPPPGGGLAPLPLLFCALNAAQGLFILLCHCLARRQVRDAYRACLCPGTKPYSEFTSNTSNTTNTRVSRQQPYA